MASIPAASSESPASRSGCGSGGGKRGSGGRASLPRRLRASPASARACPLPCHLRELSGGGPPGGLRPHSLYQSRRKKVSLRGRPGQVRSRCSHLWPPSPGRTPSRGRMAVCDGNTLWCRVGWCCVVWAWRGLRWGHGAAGRAGGSEPRETSSPLPGSPHRLLVRCRGPVQDSPESRALVVLLNIPGSQRLGKRARWPDL